MGNEKYGQNQHNGGSVKYKNEDEDDYGSKPVKKGRLSKENSVKRRVSQARTSTKASKSNSKNVYINKINSLISESPEEK